MTNKELLKLAAKAGGIKHPSGEHSIHNDGRLWDCKGLRWWNPLKDDGDALQLAMRLRITIEQDILETRVSAYVLIGLRREHFMSVSGNVSREEATRKAIVLCAASMGREM